MIPVKIINWNKKELDKETANVVERKKFKNILKSFKDALFGDLKTFLLKFLLPILAGIAVLVLILVFLVPLINNTVLTFIARFASLFACFMLIVYKVSEFMSKTYLPELLTDGSTFQVQFHAVAKNRKVVEVETEKINNPDTGNYLDVPRFIGFAEEKTGDKKYYSFASAPWDILESENDNIVLDVKNLKVFCPVHK